MMQRTLLAAAGAMVLAAVLLNAVSVVSRYVFNSSFVWADEVLVYGNIWVVAIGGLAAAIAGEHLSIDVLRTVLRRAHLRPQSILIELVTLLVSATASYASIQAMRVVMRTGQKSVAAGLPMWLPHGAILFVFATATVCAAVRLALVLLHPRGEK